ncbi:MAG: hypothetical protein CL535_16300 [Ahrensia sp.]|nr:hypothetical protein [Ahrensia sp.]|tara:strand:- start:112656 stop:113783 length:1128 start_codon:yes stop_codon:yes gene_type:complete
MADSTIGGLPDAAALDGTEYFEIQQSGNSRRSLISTIWTWVKTKLVGEAIYVGTGSGTGLDVAGDGDLAVRIHGNSYVAMQFESYRDSSAGHCRFQGIGGRGTEASPGQTQSGDGLFWIAGRGINENGSNTNDVAAIRINADGTVSSTSYAGEIEFATCPNGSTGTVTRMGIRNDGQIDFPGLATTASAANAFLDSGNDNELLRSTSSLKYKKDVEAVDPQYSKAMMGLQGIYYRSIAKADNPEWAWWGFAAEEVAEIDPRMVHWGYGEDDYDLVEVEIEPAVKAKPAKKSRLGRVVEPAVAAMPAQTEMRAVLKEGAVKSPQGVMYERFVVHHQVIIKEHQGRIKALEDENRALNEAVATLTARIDALEARLAK